MYGYIILRDIPKQLAQLDLLHFPIKGGFRGFSGGYPRRHSDSFTPDRPRHPLGQRPGIDHDREYAGVDAGPLAT